MRHPRYRVWAGAHQTAPEDAMQCISKCVSVNSVCSIVLMPVNIQFWISNRDSRSDPWMAMSTPWIVSACESVCGNLDLALCLARSSAPQFWWGNYVWRQTKPLCISSMLTSITSFSPLLPEAVLNLFSSSTCDSASIYSMEQTGIARNAIARIHYLFLYMHVVMYVWLCTVNVPCWQACGKTNISFIISALCFISDSTQIVLHWKHNMSL